MMFLSLLGAFALSPIVRDSDDISLLMDGPSTKVEQVNGDKDWADWANGILTPTVSQTVTRADVLGNGAGYSFEHNGKMIFLFGDTVGANQEYYPNYIDKKDINPFRYQARDPMAWSDTLHSEDGLNLNFFKDSSGNTLLVEPQYDKPQLYRDGTFSVYLPMGPDDIPNSGISLDGQIYLICNTGADPTQDDPHQFAYSVLATYDESTQIFHAGRTISRWDSGGHFVITALHEYTRDCGELGLDSDDSSVLMYGQGHYRKSNMYLAVIPKHGFAGGKGTRYFAGFKHGRPVWADEDKDLQPVITDVDPNNPTIGNGSVAYSKELRLWLMTFDGGRNDDATTGVYFAYSHSPVGPWSKPQLIFNAARDNGYGNFIRYYDGKTKPPTAYGPAGPTINMVQNPPATTRGGPFNPFMIERFMRVDGDKLTIFYNLSTWNPYAIVEMRSDFRIKRGP